ncbi:hypothetical protein SDC9_192912 [bioreactor metagenome]|uniref:Uncharacterized protein n=1 Tax=bioreactor metagenome TaxID=1076179 RepID=A0A645I247_9ZZZZ
MYPITRLQVSALWRTVLQRFVSTQFDDAAVANPSIGD